MVSLRNPSDLPLVGVLVDGRTYRHLLYLLLAVPLGFAYSTLFTFGVVAGLLLSVVLIGLVILLATLIGSRLVAGFERWLANALLGTELSRPDDLAEADGALAGVRTYVDAGSTWAGLGFLSLKFWVALVAFVPLALLANALPLVAAPLRYPYTADFGEVNGEPATWAIGSLQEALIALALGVAGVLLALHVANLVAYATRQMAVALLGRRAPAGAAPGSVRDGSAVDAEDAGASDAGGGADAGDGDVGDVDAADTADADSEFEFVDDPAPADRGDDAG